MRSKDIAVGYAIGYNDGLGQGGATYNGNFRAVFDDNAGVLTIVVQEGEKYADYQFGYDWYDYSEEIKTETTVGGETTETTRSFEKRIVTSLFDASGTVYLLTEYSADTGEITKYTDGTDTEIYTEEWRESYETAVTQSEGALSAAIAWVIARNMEQKDSLEQQKKSYKDGLRVGVDGGADITEQYEQDNTSLDMVTDDNGGVSEPFIGNITDGIYCTNSDGSYVKMWLDMSWTTTLSDGTVKTGRMRYEAFDADGNSLATSSSIGTAGWAWLLGDDTKVVEVIVNGSDVTCRHAQTDSYGNIKYYKIDWSPSGSTTITNIMNNAVKVGNVPPEIIS